MYKSSLENYNKYYYLVLKLDDKTLKNLGSGKFKGLECISSSPNIINSYFDIRNLMLVMEREEVEILNSLTHIDYYNVEYLSKDNFKVLRRLYGKADKYPIGSLLYQGIRKVGHLHLKKDKRLGRYWINNHSFAKLHKIVAWGMWEKFRDFDHNDVHKLNKIKSFKTYENLLKRSLSIINKVKNKYTKEELDFILRYIILGFSSCFEVEQEVLVTDKSFTVPSGSVLFIKHDNPELYRWERTGELIDSYKKELNDKYKIKELKYIPKGIISNSHKPAFGYIRYLDKIF